MIRAILYDKVANTNTGQMEPRVIIVGHGAPAPGIEPDKNSDYPIVESIAEDTHKGQKIIVVSYDNGYQRTIPDRGVEKILKL